MQAVLWVSHENGFSVILFESLLAIPRHLTGASNSRLDGRERPDRVYNTFFK